MRVNLGVDSYTETLNNLKILRKTDKKNLPKTKRIPKSKYKETRARFLYEPAGGKVVRTPDPCQLRYW